MRNYSNPILCVRNKCDILNLVFLRIPLLISSPYEFHLNFITLRISPYLTHLSKFHFLTNLYLNFITLQILPLFNTFIKRVQEKRRLLLLTSVFGGETHQTLLHIITLPKPRLQISVYFSDSGTFYRTCKFCIYAFAYASRTHSLLFFHWNGGTGVCDVSDIPFFFFFFLVSWFFVGLLGLKYIKCVYQHLCW